MQAASQRTEQQQQHPLLQECLLMYGQTDKQHKQQRACQLEITRF